MTNRGYAGVPPVDDTSAVLMKEDETMARKTHGGDENADAQPGSGDTNIETGEPIRVMLADDHVLVREGTRRLLEAEPDIEVVAEAGDGISAVEQAVASQPDVLIIDVAMPGMTGIEATRHIKQQ
ncbi:MAG TPA: response regulator transcription factor, partial [Ktedonobacterales bacterium]|nr:response regulator transcription factor [Ktedonobacterales bacterium]